MTSKQRGFMEKKNITTEQFSSLTPYHLNSSITSTECMLYLYNGMLLKKYHPYDIADCEFMKNKIITLSVLNKHKDEINIPELILPEQLISIDNILSGFTMRFISNNENLSQILQNEQIDTKRKLELLKSCGDIIQKVHDVTCVDNFLLGDIHESNFIYNRNDDKMYAVDMDSCKIADNKYSAMKLCGFICKKQEINLAFSIIHSVMLLF